MGSDCLLPYYTAQSGSASGMFNTTMGKLQRQLYKGEYDIFKYAPIFESDFIQITKRGEVIDVHNRVRMVTVGIACTSPILPLPDVMLLARPAASCEEHVGRGQVTKGRGRKATKALELTRLLPLKFVRISIHDREKQQLRLKFATGRSCYLQLCPPLDAREDLFSYWEKLVYLLRPPVDSNSSTHAIPAGDMISMPVFEEEGGASPVSADRHSKGDQDQVSIRSLPVVSDVSGASSAAYAGGEGIKHAPNKPTTTPDTPTLKPTPPAKGAASGAIAGAAAKGAVAGVVTVADPVRGDTAIAGAATKGPGDSKSSIAVAGVTNVPSKNIKMAVAGAASKTPECAASTEGSNARSPESSMSVAFAGTTSAGQPAAEAAQDSAAGAPKGGESEQDASPQASDAQARKARRERRERREKDRAPSRRSSRRHRTGESRRKSGSRGKVGQKSSGRSLTSHTPPKEDKKGKDRGSRRGSRRSSAHKGLSRPPITKESRTSHKSGRSISTVNSVSSNKRLSRISSFLRNVRATLSTKSAASPGGREVDIVSKTVEKSSMEAILETAECDQEVIIGTVRSEIVESVTLEAR